jgi:hypothetical protein
MIGVMTADARRADERAIGPAHADLVPHSRSTEPGAGEFAYPLQDRRDGSRQPGLVASARALIRQGWRGDRLAS